MAHYSGHCLESVRLTFEAFFIALFFFVFGLATFFSPCFARYILAARLRDGNSGLSALPRERGVHLLGEVIFEVDRRSEQRSVKIADAFFRDHLAVEGSDLRIGAIHKSVESQPSGFIIFSHNNPFSIPLFCKKYLSDSQEGCTKAEKGADFLNQPPFIIGSLFFCRETR